MKIISVDILRSDLDMDYADQDDCPLFHALQRKIGKRFIEVSSAYWPYIKVDDKKTYVYDGRLWNSYWYDYYCKIHEGSPENTVVATIDLSEYNPYIFYWFKTTYDDLIATRDALAAKLIERGFSE